MLNVCLRLCVCVWGGGRGECALLLHALAFVQAAAVDMGMLRSEVLHAYAVGLGVVGPC
jgi:hypothetical protein